MTEYDRKPERLSTEKTDAKRHIDISPALHTALMDGTPQVSKQA